MKTLLHPKHPIWGLLIGVLGLAALVLMLHFNYDNGLDLEKDGKTTAGAVGVVLLGSVARWAVEYFTSGRKETKDVEDSSDD